MSTLIVDELYNGINFEQSFKIQRSVSLQHIRPWVYKQGVLLTGDLTCEVYQGGTLLATSVINYTEINEHIVSQFAHGYITFTFENLVLRLEEGELETEYSVKVYMNNFTNNASNFIGLVREWDDSKYPNYGDIDLLGKPLNSFIAPLGLEFFEYRSF